MIFQNRSQKAMCIFSLFSTTHNIQPHKHFDPNQSIAITKVTRAIATDAIQHLIILKQ
jgi:hypothetical protein